MLSENITTKLTTGYNSQHQELVEEIRRTCRSLKNNNADISFIMYKVSDVKH